MSTMEAHNEAASPQSASDNATDGPLTIALVVDTFGNRGNGTSNSALQWAQELERQGHQARLVGINAPNIRPERTTFRW